MKRALNVVLNPLPHRESITDSGAGCTLCPYCTLRPYRGVGCCGSACSVTSSFSSSSFVSFSFDFICLCHSLSSCLCQCQCVSYLISLSLSYCMSVNPSVCLLVYLSSSLTVCLSVRLISQSLTYAHVRPNSHARCTGGIEEVGLGG